MRIWGTRPLFETRTKKLVAAKHEARLNVLLGSANRAALLAMLAKIAREF